ncbi:hypothetical protein [Natronobacterium gregoryi]|uniref:Uncharacterized protein n=2 Tax=Natronobacterium gregoryi TaxID=44930 RepID=L0AIR5_NATGS|nr:hypothetical protein [Natronobacterium gregoryi]AFZ73783.1 hypothetical protein Natgr_2634 [Natronobacterium gregoryi SP2]ELY65585.1 hypothetical protein C490_13720 [Natronobacterium gregoryi SP2]PLK17723.1 hypothetical protein CYV19_18950 [Natronobacterium gregoryi SP2]SFJ75488.1 hypothetical protein SAMN05443661_1782 [Natronobacterium gregoryi]
MYTETIDRAKKIDESKEIITEVEDEIGVQLTESRRALQVAGSSITVDSLYVEQMVQAMAEAAGYAIESGHDDLAADAIQNVTDLEEILADDE